MGLDMYAYKVKKEKEQEILIEQDGEIVINRDIERNEEDYSEIAYWRKANAVHHWFVDLAYDKGLITDLNCAYVPVTHEDLDNLFMDIAENKLEPMDGFFFGSQEIYPSDIIDTVKFILKAKQSINEGYSIYYTAWF